MQNEGFHPDILIHSLQANDIHNGSCSRQDSQG